MKCGEVAEGEEVGERVRVVRHLARVPGRQLGDDARRGRADVVHVQLGLGQAGDESGEVGRCDMAPSMSARGQLPRSSTSRCSLSASAIGEAALSGLPSTSTTAVRASRPPPRRPGWPLDRSSRRGRPGRRGRRVVDARCSWPTIERRARGSSRLGWRSKSTSWKASACFGVPATARPPRPAGIAGVAVVTRDEGRYSTCTVPRAASIRRKSREAISNSRLSGSRSPRRRRPSSARPACRRPTTAPRLAPAPRPRASPPGPPRWRRSPVRRSRTRQGRQHTDDDAAARCCVRPAAPPAESGGLTTSRRSLRGAARAAAASSDGEPSSCLPSTITVGRALDAGLRRRWCRRRRRTAGSASRIALSTAWSVTPAFLARATRSSMPGLSVVRLVGLVLVEQVVELQRLLPGSRSWRTAPRPSARASSSRPASRWNGRYST